ncbi:MAG: methyltransferase, partial [Clostridiales bacterium]|nr:methyltransferase [Clostridiales bacterium]
MTKRENVMAVLEGRQPDYYGDLMDAVQFVPDPVFLSDRAEPDGRPHRDTWGVTFRWEPGTPGPHPLAAPETLAIPDIERWEEYLKVPSLRDLDWAQCERDAEAVDRSEMFAGMFCGGGLFERSHHLLGFQNALEYYILYEDEMRGLLEKIAEYKIELIKLASKHMRPDIIFFHDDWGSKTNVFLPPPLWRRLIKPLHREIVSTAHECGIIFMHHADCICEPLVEDMVEIGIDIWQGVIAQNNIPEIQRVTDGKLAMVGGIDGPKIDVDTTEEFIRAEVRRAFDEYCPAGRFFPSIPNGCCFREWNNMIYRDELERYGRAWA